jgi:hypothetical protein
MLHKSPLRFPFKHQTLYLYKSTNEPSSDSYNTQTTIFKESEFREIHTLPSYAGCFISSHSMYHTLADISSSVTGIFFLLCYNAYSKSRDSSVGIALGYGLDDRGSRVRLPAGAGNFSLHHRVQNGSGAHPASYPMGTSGFFPGGKSTGARS